MQEVKPTINGKLIEPEMAVTSQANIEHTYIVKSNDNTKVTTSVDDEYLSNDVLLMRDTWTPKPVREIQPTPVSLDMWCDRMGGSTKASLDKLIKRGKFGKPTTRTLSQNKILTQSLVNQRAASHSGQIPRTSIPGYKFWGDAQGPNVKSFFHHYVYVFGWLDDATNFGVVYFGKTKSEAKSAFMKLKAWCPHKISVISTDGAKEYFSGELQEVATNADIFWTCSPPYVPQRNPRIENWWYRTDRLTRHMLWHCGATKIFWAFAKSYAGLMVNLKEYGPTGEIPYEQFMNQKFNYGKLRVFGCTVAIRHMTTQGQGTHQKHNMKSQLGFYLGFDMFHWKHICYGLDEKQLYYGADFVPQESNFGALHLFMKRNPTTDIELTQELLDFQKDAESQGEIFDETKLTTNLFGISKPSQELWKDCPKPRKIDTELPSLEMFNDVVEPTTETRPEGELPQETQPTAVPEPATTQDNITQPLQDSTQPSQENIVQKANELSTTPSSPMLQVDNSDKTYESLEQPVETREPIYEPVVTRSKKPEADPLEVQQRVIDMAVDAGVEKRTTKSTTAKDPSTQYNPSVAPSRANYESRQLAQQNEALKGLFKKRVHVGSANWCSLMTTLMVCDRHILRVDEPTEPDELDLEWHRNVEYAMHAFMTLGIEEGGYWTDFECVNKKNKSKTKKRKHNAMMAMEELEPIYGCAMPTVDGPEPQSYKHLLNGNWENKEEYIKATESEMGGHLKQNTYVPCHLPEGVKPIDSRFVYVRKINPDNSIRYKARWVARGFTQVDGENFNWDTVFAPVLRMTSLRWLFSLIAEYDMEVTSADVVQAFLQSNLREEGDGLQDIYVKLPEGYETTCPTTKQKYKYGRLIKALYGLKQSPRRWSEKLTSVMKSIGFKPHPEDPCIFIKREGASIAIYGIYVDDMIKCTNDPAMRKRIDKILSKELEIEHQGELKEFLGLEFKWLKSKDGKAYLNVSQEKYCKKILERFGMDKANPSPIPATASGEQTEVYLWPNPEPPENVDKELLGRYRAGIGALIYLSVMTRPDISYAVNAAAQYMSNPNKDHEKALMKIFRYLVDKAHYSLKYFKTGNGMTMEAYVDANFMGDHDSRSVTGKIIFSGNGILEWGSNRQSTVATSTSHAECTAFFEMLKSVIHVRELAKQENFGMPEKVTGRPTTIHCDNSACVELVRKRCEKPNRTKHWQMQWNWLHEQRDVFHTYTAVFREGKTNWSDVFTKPLTRDVFYKMVVAMKLDVV